LLSFINVSGFGLVDAFAGVQSPGGPCSGDSCQPGDANADGFVNLADLGVIINAFRGTPAPGNGDCNGDGFTNLADLGCVITKFRGPPGPTPTPAPQIIDVSMEDNFFSPQNLTINEGDTVKWTNMGNNNHTTTSDVGLGAIWNSDNLFPMPNGMPPGAMFQFTFNSVGSFPYFCQFHGAPGGIGMAGTVTVEP
ncbi:dockerin type I domain-containing protein, partial [Desulfobacterota bacterium AH_259_B03_O07]|nr:dockerin type I domain-containing protein [Desulfobacterota bacterium AH_259_B03_O07]